MKITYKDHMGTDLSVVNAARVSFDKEHEEFQENDVGLIRYLATHGHWTPFGHATLQVHVKAPIFVARQLVKHQVGLVWNEVSRRYVDHEPELYVPTILRRRPLNKKQGSTGTINSEDQPFLIGFIEDSTRSAVEDYEYLLECGVCPEQARIVLPQNMYTEWFWTGSLYAMSRVVNLRCHQDAQRETRDLVSQLIPILDSLWPVSSKYLITQEARDLINDQMP